MRASKMQHVKSVSNTRELISIHMFRTYKSFRFNSQNLKLVIIRNMLYSVVCKFFYYSNLYSSLEFILVHFIIELKNIIFSKCVKMAIFIFILFFIKFVLKFLIHFHRKNNICVPINFER